MGVLHSFTFSHLAFSAEADMSEIQRKARAAQRQIWLLRKQTADLQGLALNMPGTSTHGLARICCAADTVCLCGAALLYKRHLVAGLTALLPAAALGAYGSTKLEPSTSAEGTALARHYSLHQRCKAARRRQQKTEVLKEALFECATSMLQVCHAAQAVVKLAASVQASSMSER